MTQEDATTYEGKVIWFKKSFGFLSWEKDGIPQKDLFCYWSDLIDEGQGFKTLKKDQAVSFQIGKNLRDQDKAVNIRVISG